MNEKIRLMLMRELEGLKEDAKKVVFEELSVKYEREVARRISINSREGGRHKIKDPEGSSASYILAVYRYGGTKKSKPS